MVKSRRVALVSLACLGGLLLGCADPPRQTGFDGTGKRPAPQPQGLGQRDAIERPGFLSAGFLEEGARRRNMNLLSIHATDSDFDAMLSRHRAHGFNQILLYLANEGDGEPVPTTFYRDAWFGAIDPARVRMMRNRIERARAAGFAVELWGLADDSPSLRQASPEQIGRFYGHCLDLFGDLADSWCVGLEIDEWGLQWWTDPFPTGGGSVAQWAVARLAESGRPVAIHTTADYRRGLDLCRRAGARRFNVQTGWLTSPGEMRKVLRWLNDHREGIEIVISEFNKDSTTPLATALATEAARLGAIGTQTGRPE